MCATTWTSSSSSSYSSSLSPSPEAADDATASDAAAAAASGSSAKKKNKKQPPSIAPRFRIVRKYYRQQNVGVAVGVTAVMIAFFAMIGLAVIMSPGIIHSAGFEQQQQQQQKQQHQRRTAAAAAAAGGESDSDPASEKKKHVVRLLYIVTSLAQYNTGTRNTVKGSDRLQETLIPVLSEGVTSMVADGFDVDVFLICHYTLSQERLDLVKKALPGSVALDTWYDATPLGYDTSKDPFTKLENRTFHLARQHRFVIKDRILNYDMFVNFEDDMVITAAHVRHWMAVTDEIYKLRQAAPESVPHLSSNRQAQEHYHGTMTKDQLKRTIPGLIRVEALLDEDKHGAQRELAPVPVDLMFNGVRREVDPEVCCHVAEETANHHIPKTPAADKLILWETSIFALGVRQMPQHSWLNWVTLLRGPNQHQLNVSAVIGDYWSNRNKDYWTDRREHRRPSPMEFKYINNQGGWMATRQQLWEWHTEICPGGFLPPYESPHYRYDGLDMRNVEWYSGGMQLSTTRHACNMQRIVLLDPANFSKSLIYHSANNKQRQHQGKVHTISKANTLLGQLNTIRKRAEEEMLQEGGKM